MKAWILYVFAILVISSVAWPVVEPPQTAARLVRSVPITQDVVVLVLDDIANDRVPAYGEIGLPPDRWPATPNLDALGAEGMRFTEYRSCPTCAPTRCSLLTGLVPFHTGVGSTPTGGDRGFTPPTIGDVFRGAGFTTLAAGKWGIDGGLSQGWTGREPLEQGFDRFAGTRGNAGDYFAWDLNLDGAEAPVAEYRPSVILGHAEQLWHGAAGAPRLLYYATALPHKPLHDPPGFMATHPPSSDPLDQWVRMIEAADFIVGKVRQLVGPEDWLVVISDNGDLRPCTTFSDWPECKGTLYEPGVNVPLWVVGPGVPPGSICDALIAAEDVLPTLCDLAQVPPPAGLDGVSFAAAVTDPGTPLRRAAVVLHHFRPNLGLGPPQFNDLALVRRDGWKLIRDQLTGSQELFQLTVPGWDGDPVQNLPVELELAAELDAIVAAW